MTNPTRLLQATQNELNFCIKFKYVSAPVLPSIFFFIISHGTENHHHCLVVMRYLGSLVHCMTIFALVLTVLTGLGSPIKFRILFLLLLSITLPSSLLSSSSSLQKHDPVVLAMVAWLICYTLYLLYLLSYKLHLFGIDRMCLSPLLFH
ncbi:hypothetical protein PHAVU_L005201 [Phaseolus vulgaris]|uniref:Uncharacterized protein n=2 Tax=Phaseolus vulgaris TaxID=3885 RepID=A0ACC3P1B4_PHAVU|nr:hypothetical protein PHAVU_001G081800g [Phaseolus vulgaris]ESW33577.1 hypothetical protein PHAVU_001G081800g [Phaseolus vulgaris]